MDQKVIIISGEKGEGKTSFLIDVLAQLKESTIQFRGFVATKIIDKNQSRSYLLNELNSDFSIELCTNLPINDYIRQGNFYFNPVALQKGREILTFNHLDENRLFVIDEIGIFELNGHVWFEAFSKLLKISNLQILITVRKKIIDQVIAKFGLQQFKIFAVGSNVGDIVDEIISK